MLSQTLLDITIEVIHITQQHANQDSVNPLEDSLLYQ